MHIQEDIKLAEYTTFKIGGRARFFCIVTDEAGLLEAVHFAQERAVPFFILGGGSNILVSDGGFDGLVIKMEMKGIQEKIQNSKFRAQKSENTAVVITAAAGEQWDDMVEWAVSRDLQGLENLSAIPGTVGAAPVQNIGAYGAEVSRVIVSVRALDVKAMRFVGLSSRDCAFAYRDSMFKHNKGRYVVASVDFRLTKGGAPFIGYKDVREYFAAKDVAQPSIAEVRESVINIRWGKLPDWKLWGTAGSFFKNPVIAASRYAALKEKYPGLPAYPESDGNAADAKVKVSLAWILDKVCNAKDLCVGGACVYEKQALVLVAKPGATSEEVVELSRELSRRVKEETGIDIECEVEWVN